MELKIDPELKAFITPLSEAEKQSLENDILINGCREPVTVWNGVIVDGHNRYDICQKHNLPFQTREESFVSKTEAMVWMHLNQSSRRNLNTVERVVMELKCKPLLIELGKQKQGCRRDLLAFLEDMENHNTRAIIARRAGTSENTVYRIEKILEVADEATKEDLLEENISVNKAYNQLFPKEKKKAPVIQKSEQESGESKSETEENLDLKDRLEGFTDEELKLELFRREEYFMHSSFKTCEQARKLFNSTFETGSRRYFVPTWGGELTGIFNAVTAGYCENIRKVIELSKNYFFTDTVISGLFDYLEGVSEYAQEHLDYALLEKLGDEYEPFFDDVDDDE